MTAHPLQTSSLKRFLAIASATILSLTGCSDRPPRHESRAEQMNAAAAKPTLAANEFFFDEKLLVEADLGQGFGGRGGPGGGGGHGRQGHPGGGRRGGGGMSGSPGGGPGGGGEEMPARDGGSGGGISLHESTMPPVALRLRLTNKSDRTVEVTFLLCKSELGDFAVRPEKLALAPGQSAEPDAMTSRLGLRSGELRLAVRLRMSGNVEQKDLILKAVTPIQPPTSANP